MTLEEAVNKLDKIVEKNADAAEDIAFSQMKNDYVAQLDKAHVEYAKNHGQLPAVETPTDTKGDGGVDPKKVAGAPANNGGAGDASKPPENSVLTGSDGTKLEVGKDGLIKTDDGFERTQSDGQGITTITKYDEKGKVTSKKTVKTASLPNGGNQTITSVTTPKPEGEGGPTTTTTTVTKSQDGKTVTTEIDTDGVKKSKETQETDAAGDVKVTTETADKVVITGYKVVSGDNPTKIANKLKAKHEGFTVSPQEIMRQNQITNDRTIQIGKKLDIEMHKKKS